MSFQAHVVHNSKCEDVRRRIFHSHLAYLNQEETPAKLDQRHNLESLIVEFLSLVPHDEKFCLSEITDIFHSSINDNLNFSAFKAASAFEALEKYATNLISHPWRKEYKIVKLYSGFYKHSVESQLLGAETVFYQLGYQPAEGILFLDGPVDPDRVARVALDCLVACVECQIMLQICEKVKSFKCSWLEVHHVRQEYICGIEEAVRILQQLKRRAAELGKQERWLNRENVSSKEKLKPSINDTTHNSQKTGILIDVSNTWPSSVPPTTSYVEDILVPQSSLHNSFFQAKPHKNTLVSHSKSPSWSEGVLPQVHAYQLRPSGSKLENDHFTGSFDDHMKGNFSVDDGNLINSPRFPLNSESLPDTREGSWNLLHSPLHRSQYQSSHNAFSNFDHDCHKVGYNPVPNIRMPYGSQYSQSYPAPHMMPLGVPGYPYPLPQNLLFNHRQCICQSCCEHQQQLMMSNQIHNKDVTNNYDGSSSFLKSDKHHGENSLDLNSAVFHLSLEGHSSGEKVGQFPLDGPTFVPPKNPSDPLKVSIIHRSNGATKSQQSTKRGSFYDNVPSTLENEVINPPFLLSSQSVLSKTELCANGSTSFCAPNKSRGQKGVTSVDSVGNGLIAKGGHCKFHGGDYSSSIMDQTQDMTVPLTPKEHGSIKSHAPAYRNTKESKRWSCTSCTFYNAAEKRICEMCGRSKYPGAESMPLVSGGRECPQCTLVNRKDTEDCTACGTSLKDSPTYI